MYNPSNLDPTYDEWLQKAHLLNPPFDYFSFANLVLKDVRITNILYRGILTKNINNSSKYLDEYVKALKLFELRSKKNSAFSIAYEAYWSKRDEDSVISVMRKRQLEGASNITNDIVSSMEHIIKKSCTTGPSASTMPAHNASQTKESHDTNTSEKETKDALSTIKHVDRSYGDLDVLSLDNSDVLNILSECWTREHVNNIKRMTDPPVIEMTEVCKALLSLINNSTGTPTTIITQIRQFIGTHHSLDESEYADYYFTESMLLHFLHMMNSPRNPISFSMKERTAAPITTIYLLHNLFLSCNDLISFHWIERTTEITKDVKWDGICFSLQDKRFTPVLIEFSGGIKFNSTAAKEHGDEGKMIKSMTKLLEYGKYVRRCKSPVSQFYCRFFDNQVFFEALYLADDEQSIIKRSFCKIVCPTTPRELKSFAKNIPGLLKWKQAIISAVIESGN